MADYYLVHHGIKGQKWGIRRYQNEDGTLTEEGYRRYNENYENNRKKMFESYDKTGGQEGGNRGQQMKKKHKENLDEVLKRSRDPNLENNYNLKQEQLRKKEEAYQKAFFRKKPRFELLAARAQAREATEDLVKSIVNGAEQYIRTLPKDQQDLRRSYVYQYLGYEW